MNHKALRLTFVSMLILILNLALVSASPAWTGTGNYVRSIWWSIITRPYPEYLAALLIHDIDAGVVPRPTDLPAIIGAGYTVTAMSRIGQTLLATSNRRWPTGTPTGHPADPYYANATSFRKALFRLVDRDAILALSAPLKSKAEFWLPARQAAWIELDPASPDYAPTPDVDRMIAVGLLDAAGFVQGSTLNPHYTGEPWSARYWRIDPTTENDLAPVELVTINPAEAPLTYDAALMMQDWWQTAGIPCQVLATSLSNINSKLVNADLYDYQIIYPADIYWGATAPTNLYDLTHSLNLPVWNLVGMNRSMGSTNDAQASASMDLDYWGEEMFKTLSINRVKRCALELQNILRDTAPYLPLLLDNGFSAFTGPFMSPTRGTSRGYLGIVNAEGYGALGYGSNIGLLSPIGQVWSSNVWAKMLGRADVKGNDEMIWGLNEELDTLNPLVADTQSAWQVLSLVTDVLLQQNPYNHKYMAWAADPSVMDFDPDVGYTPIMKPWVGPGRAQDGGNGVYDIDDVLAGPAPPANAALTIPGASDKYYDANSSNVWDVGEPAVRDTDNNGLYVGEYIYRDVDMSDNVTVGDIRLTPVPSYAAGSTVNEGDDDLGSALVAFKKKEKHTENIEANSVYDVDEFIYKDTQLSGDVNARDVRLTAVGPYEAGSTVAREDSDVGSALVAFAANEKHRENIAANRAYDVVDVVLIGPAPPANAALTIPGASDKYYDSIINNVWDVGEPAVRDTDNNGRYGPEPTYAYDPDTGRMELATYAGKAVEDVTAADLQGDDQLGMRTVWKLRDNLYWHDSDPGPDGIFNSPQPIPDDGTVYQVTTADVTFMMNEILIGQQNERYFSNWWYVNNYTALDQLKFEVYEERRYPFAFESHSDVSTLGPKHIWEPDLNLDDADPNNDIHHELWTGWQVSYMENMIMKRNDMPCWNLSRLIGFGPYMYHISGPDDIGPGWQPYILAHLETNPAYFGTYTPWFPDGKPGRIVLGDVDLNQKVEMVDVDIITAAFGSRPGDPHWDPKADITLPAQFVQLDDLNLVVAKYGYTWGPYVPYTIPPEQ